MTNREPLLRVENLRQHFKMSGGYTVKAVNEVRSVSRVRMRVESRLIVNVVPNVLCAYSGFFISERRTEKTMLYFRRILAFLCYLVMLAADAVAVYVIYISIFGQITYYFGMLIFIPVFIISYWFATFFMQLTSGRVRGRRVMSKGLRVFFNTLGTLLSLALVGFWGYIYFTQQLNQAANENLVVETASYRYIETNDIINERIDL